MQLTCERMLCAGDGARRGEDSGPAGPFSSDPTGGEQSVHGAHDRRLCDGHTGLLPVLAREDCGGKEGGIRRGDCGGGAGNGAGDAAERSGGGRTSAAGAVGNDSPGVTPQERAPYLNLHIILLATLTIMDQNASVHIAKTILRGRI